MNAHKRFFSMTCAALLTLGGVALAQAGAASPKPQAQPKTTQSSTAQAAQTPGTDKSATPPAKPGAQWRRQCVKGGDFCVQVPAAWKALGDVFDGAGFSVGEPDPQRDPENLNQITVTYVDVPQSGDKPRPTASELIDIVLGAPAEGTTQEITERAQLVVAGMPTQLVKLKLHSESGEWMEEVALMDSDELVYAVALVCAPQDDARLEPVFKHVLESWTPIPVAPKK